MSRWPGRLISKTPVTPSGPAPTSSAPGTWTIPEMAYWTKQGRWPNASADPYWSYVSYLLGTTSTNAAQNNTFLDSSTNNSTITRVGNTTQGSFTPYGTLWSNYFDGSGDYLTSTGGAASAMGTGDFSCEAFVYWTSYPTQYTSIFSTRSTNNANAAAFTVGVESSGYVYAFSSAFIAQTSSGVFALNTWNHVVFTRSGTTARLFVNGVLRATGSNSQNFSDQGFAVGANRDGTEPGAGYVSNLRLVKGSIPTDYQTSSTSVGTTIFTPPAAPLTAISGTSILTCQSNRFIDNSTNSFALTVNGNTSVAPSSPFVLAPPGYDTSVNGGSAYLDGSSYLTAPANSVFAFGTGDFTVECWVNFSPGSAGGRITDRLPGGGAYGTWGFNISPTTFTFSEVVAGEPGVTASGLPNMTSTWTHLAACRSGSTLRLFANGVLVGSGTNTTNFNNSSYALCIGAAYETAITGYLSNVRIVKGTALYTAAFTPPTTPVTAVSGTSILCNFTNAGIYDASMNNDAQTTGNTQVSTGQAKFGTTSAYFDGSGVLSVPANPAFNFGTGDFTIECWLYPTVTTTVYLVGQAASSDYAPVLLYLTSGKPGIAVSPSIGTWTINNYVASALTLNTWSHVAAVRYGNKWSIYVNGVENVIAASTAVTPYVSTDPLGIGGEATGAPNYPYYGYIDDLRITKGYARYTANFTPPTAALPVY